MRGNGIERGFFGVFEFDSNGCVVWNPAFTFRYTITGAAIGSNLTLNLPLITATDTLAALGVAQTFSRAQTITIGNTVNAVGLTINQNDTTNNPRAVSLVNAGTGATLFIDPNGVTSASTSVGGAILLENTGNTGAGFIIYSNAGAASGRLMNIRADNALFDQAAFHVDYDGTANAVEIVHNGSDASGQALNVVSTNTLDSTMGVNGTELTKGTIKVVHTGTGTDSSASGISIDLQGTGTAAQGIYVDSTASGGTTGKLLRLRNQTIDRFTVESDGSIKIANPAGSFMYSILPSAIAANYNLTLPLLTANDTVTTLGLAQTFTASKTFSAFTQLAFVDANAGLISLGSGTLIMGATVSFTMQAAIVDVAAGQFYSNAGMLVGAPSAGNRVIGFAVETASQPGVYFTNNVLNDGGYITFDNGVGASKYHRFGISGAAYLGDMEHTDTTRFIRWDASANTLTLENTDGVVDVRLSGSVASVFNEQGADLDYRMEGDTDVNLFFLDASTDRIGIGTATPAYKLDVNGDINLPGASTYRVGGTAGVSGTFTTADAKTVTVTKGIITAIV